MSSVRFGLRCSGPPASMGLVCSFKMYWYVYRYVCIFVGFVKVGRLLLRFLESAGR